MAKNGTFQSRVPLGVPFSIPALFSRENPYPFWRFGQNPEKWSKLGPPKSVFLTIHTPKHILMLRDSLRKKGPFFVFFTPDTAKEFQLHRGYSRKKRPFLALFLNFGSFSQFRAIFSISGHFLNFSIIIDSGPVFQFLTPF